MHIVIAVVVSVVLLLMLRTMVSARIRATRRRNFPPGRDGIVDGAESIALGDGEQVVLLLHGFGDSPQTLMPVARALHSAGFAVRAPLLPGHGRTLDAFAASRARHWMDEALRAYNAIAPEGRTVAVVGVSMGGAIACDMVASLEPDRAPLALVLITPYLHLPPAARLLTTLWPVWSMVRPWVPGNREASIRDARARARSLGYGVATPRLLRELRLVVERGIDASRRLHLPTLAIFSRTDYRIPTAAAQEVFKRLGSEPKELLWVENSGHLVTIDHDAAVVAQATTAWIARWVRAG